MILTTQKDWTKIAKNERRNAENDRLKMWYLAVELAFISGENKLRELIQNVLAGKISSQSQEEKKTTVSRT